MTFSAAEASHPGGHAHPESCASGAIHPLLLSIQPPGLEQDFWKSRQAKDLLLTTDKWAFWVILLNFFSAYQIASDLQNRVVRAVLRWAFLVLLPLPFITRYLIRFYDCFYYRNRELITLGNRVLRAAWMCLFLYGATVDDYNSRYIRPKLADSVAQWKIALQIIILGAIVLLVHCHCFPLHFKRQLLVQTTIACCFWRLFHTMTCALTQSSIAQGVYNSCRYLQEAVYTLTTIFTEAGGLVHNDRLCSTQAPDFLVGFFTLSLGLVVPLYISYHLELATKCRYLATSQLQHQGTPWQPSLWHHVIMMIGLVLLSFVAAELVTEYTSPVACVQ